MAISTSARRSSSAATAAIRPCARRRGSRSRISARRWTCCGSACRRRGQRSGRQHGRVPAGRIFVMINRGDYWQCAYVIPKGSIEEVRRQGLRAFPRRDRGCGAAASRDRVGEIKDWDQVKLLTVAVDRLKRWHRAGPALHRRCRACDVADRRCRHQPRGSGRGGGGQHPGRAAARRRGRRRRCCKQVQDRREFPTRVTQRCRCSYRTT